MNFYFKTPGHVTLRRCVSKREAMEKAQNYTLLTNSPTPCAEVYRGETVKAAVLIRRYWRDADALQNLDY